MCRNCHPATRTTVALVRATPVDILRLGVSLAAYDTVKPAIRRLQLCHRFGKGSNVHITKLPQELLDMIICIVLAQEKRNHSLKWSQAKECYDGTCSVLGHFDDDDLEDIRDTALECVKEDTDIEDDDFDDQVEDAMLEIAAEHDLRWDVCDGREMLWDELTHMSNPDKICHTLAKQGFTKYDELLRSDFGLQVFITKQTIPSNMFKALNYFNWRDRPQRETIAYLTLPCKRHVQDIAARDSSDENEFDYIVNNAASISNVIDPATLVISNEQKRRFHKAMKFLDLNPKIYNFQVVDDYDKDGPILTKEQKTNGPSVKEAEGICNRLDEKVKELERSEWPKLLNLVSVTNKHGPY